MAALFNSIMCSNCTFLYAQARHFTIATDHHIHAKMKPPTAGSQITGPSFIDVLQRNPPMINSRTGPFTTREPILIACLTDTEVIM